MLISEWLEGTPLSRIIADGTQEERDVAGLLYLRFLLSSPGRAGLLHADPHPGNFRITPDGRFGVLDFGAVAHLPDGFPPMVGNLLRIAMKGDADAVLAGLREEGFVKTTTKLEAQGLLDFLDPFVDPARTETFLFSREWLRGQFARLNDPRNPDFAIGLKMNLPPDYLLIHRVWLGAIGVMCQLNAEVPMRAELERWVPGFAVAEAAGGRSGLTVRALAADREAGAGALPGSERAGPRAGATHLDDLHASLPPGSSMGLPHRPGHLPLPRSRGPGCRSSRSCRGGSRGCRGGPPRWPGGAPRRPRASRRSGRSRRAGRAPAPRLSRHSRRLVARLSSGVPGHFRQRPRVRSLPVTSPAPHTRHRSGGLRPAGSLEAAERPCRTSPAEVAPPPVAPRVRMEARKRLAWRCRPDPGRVSDQVTTRRSWARVTPT